MHPITIIPLAENYAVSIDNIKCKDGSAFWAKYRFGSFIVALYNCDVNYIANRIITTIKQYKWNSLEELVEKCFDNMGKSNNDLIVVMMMLNEIHSELYQWMDSPDDEDTASEKIASVLKAYIVFKPLIDKLISKSFQDATAESLSALQKEGVFANFFLDKNKSMRVAYTLGSIYPLFALDVLKVQEKEICIKRCQNCGRLFLPNSRTDEIYCNNVYINGKTCKQVGYTNKLKSDPFKAEYRKAYKTQHAKMKRNLKNIPNYKEKYFDPWVDAAKNAMEQSRSENNIEAFARWIKEHR